MRTPCKTSCNTVVILGRTLTANTWEHKGRDAENLRYLLQAQFMVLTKPLPQRLKAHRHQLPSAPKARRHEPRVEEIQYRAQLPPVCTGPGLEVSTSRRIIREGT